MLMAFSTLIFIIFMLAFFISNIKSELSRKSFFLFVLGFMLPDLIYLLSSLFGEETGSRAFLITNSVIFCFFMMLFRNTSLFYGTLLHLLFGILLFSHYQPLYPLLDLEVGFDLMQEVSTIENLILFVSFVLSLIFMRGFVLRKRNRADLLRFISAFLGGLLLTLPSRNASFIGLFLVLAGVFVNDEYLRSVYYADVIYFCGIDGSGKTTHAKETVKIFSGRGVKITTEHFFKNPLVTFLSSVKRRFIGWKKEETVTYSPDFTRHVKKHFLPKLRAYFILLDNLFYVGLKLLWHKLKGEWVIADRFFYDYYLRLKLLDYNVKGLNTIYERLFPKRGVVFDINPKLAYLRRREHPMWYYVKAREKYLELAEKHCYPVLQTEKPFESVQEELNKIIEGYLHLK